MKEKKENNADYKLAMSSLDALLQKRTGGAVNFRGIEYQVLYSCMVLIDHLDGSLPGANIQLEGIEDVDIIASQVVTEAEYVQLKSSVNKLDAGGFWNLQVLQNFLEVYRINPDSKFRLVYNMRIVNGHLDALVFGKSNAASERFWIDKLSSLGSPFNYQDFLSKISFEQLSVQQIYDRIIIALLKKWKVNKGTELQFLRALFYKVMIWSKERTRVHYEQMNALFQEIKDSYSKAIVNQAITENWIEKTVFTSNGPLRDAYYDGKAATPLDIGQKLPARRSDWEKIIQHELSKIDVTVIKASSGQGKSTLAWQVAYNLSEKYNVYQIQFCADQQSVNSIVEFLETRIQIGELPLVVIDGLNAHVELWSRLVEKMTGLAVKFLLTTREEDWYRFGADISRMSLKLIDISLSMTEAKDIFVQLKSKGKVHLGTSNWQPIWEQVQRSGLLIEYTYLLTKGQMIAERLDAQLKLLNANLSGSAKIEILRLISLADCLNIKVKTSKLIKYISATIGFQTDRDLALKELENEYFLNFESQYVIGLHPVRSTHLKNLLHQHLPVKDSLLNLFDILDEASKYDFYINAPSLIEENFKIDFYDELAEKLTNASYVDLVRALEGVLHGEPQKYWEKHRIYFDEAFSTGGIDLFVMTTTPFVEKNALEGLANLMGNKFSNLGVLSEVAQKVPDFSFQDTDLAIFGSAMVKAQSKRTTNVSSYQGLDFLVKWLKKLGLKMSFPKVSRSDGFIDELINLELTEAMEMVTYFQATDLDGYRDFIIRHKGGIISYLKRETDSPTILEIGKDVQINYLLFDKDVERANELSVSRIEVVNAFLPFYERYCVEAIVLPFPSEEIVSAVKQNSFKMLTANALGDRFTQRLNQIWTAEIDKKYQEHSAFDWQKNLIALRRGGIEWCKCTVRFLDGILEGNINKKQSAARELEKQRSTLSDLMVNSRSFPVFQQGDFEEKLHKADIKTINEWTFELSKTNNQLLNLFFPETEHDRHVLMINMKALYLKVGSMQVAFKQIESKTFVYFELADLIAQEKMWYERLFSSASYYITNLPIEQFPAVPVARKAVEQWWSVARRKKLVSLLNVLKEIERNKGYEIIKPAYIEETETLTYAIFALQNYHFSEEKFFQLSLDFAQLHQCDIDFITLVLTNQNVATGAIRFKQEYFDVMRRHLTGEVMNDFSGITPLPMNLSDKLLEPLVGISLPVSTDLDDRKGKRIAILIDLWKLSEYRQLLKLDSDIEKDWLTGIEDRYRKLIKTNINSLIIDNSYSDDFKMFVELCLSSEKGCTQDEIVKLLYFTGQID